MTPFSVYLFTVSVYVKLWHTAHVQQLDCCVKKRQTLLRPPVASKQPISQSCELRDLGHSMDELKRRFIDVWCGLEQSIFDEAIDHWRGRHTACMSMLEDISSTACELTMLILSICVTFNVTFLTVTSFITKSWLASTFLFILHGN